MLLSKFLLLPPENHILEDVNKCVIALQEKDVDGLDRTAGAIRGRAARVIHVVTSEMDNYEPGVYTEKVLEATKLLSNTGTLSSSFSVLAFLKCHSAYVFGMVSILLVHVDMQKFSVSPSVQCISLEYLLGSQL